MKFIFNKLRFLAYLQKGLSSRQLRRLATLDLLRKAAGSKDVPAQFTDTLNALSQLAPSAALHKLNSHHDGLLDTDATERLERVGPNEVEQEKPMSWREHLWLCYRNPFNLLLTALAIVSYATEDLFAAGVIALMVAILLWRPQGVYPVTSR